MIRITALDVKLPQTEMVNFAHIEDECTGIDIEIEETNGKKLDFFVPTIQSHPQPWCGQHLASSDTVTKNFYNYTDQDGKDKTPMCRIAELSRYHKFKYNYKLMDESGPAHKKLFTVQLVMSPSHGQLTFEGSGLSIKKAQQAAAAEALKHLNMAEPPDRPQKRRKLEPPLTPVQMLSQVARRLQLQEPIYQSILKKPTPLMAKNIPPPPNIFPPLSIPPPPPLAIPGFPPPVFPLPNGEVGFISKPFEVAVTLYPGKVIVGVGPNYPLARDAAASEALRFLSPAVQALDTKVEQEQRKLMTPVADSPNNEENGEELMDGISSPTQPKHRQKSVISYVHECALQLKMNVQFEVLLEEGPPHDRNYVVQCSLLNANHEVVIQNTGEGRKKKEATQVACVNVLNTLRSPQYAPQIFIANSLKKLTRRNSLAKDVKKKTIVKDMKMDPSYGHQINPVSRLIQVLQTRGEPEPQFTLVGEHGQSRYKEFVMEVACGERFCTGLGPNKRLAKRAAAEAMLAEIGYVKPLPAPGKSLLKKKNDPMMNIGMFDMSDMTENLEGDIKPPDSASPPTGRDSGGMNWELSVDASSPPDGSIESSGHNSPSEGGVPPSPGARRRVTFNTQVKACPPPEDANYPKPELAPLKADVVVEGKLKRLRKAKEGKRSLSTAQTDEIVESAKIFLNNLTNNMYEGQQYISRIRLEEYSERYKFSVQFTNFPKSPDGNDQTYFALVSLGLEKPLVCHGSGLTVDLAADNAAYNAIVSLSHLNDPPTSPTPQ